MGEYYLRIHGGSRRLNHERKPHFLFGALHLALVNLHSVMYVPVSPKQQILFFRSTKLKQVAVQKLHRKDDPKDTPDYFCFSPPSPV
jgi:hypothetical protein